MEMTKKLWGVEKTEKVEAAAQNGDASAQAELGLRFKSGLGGLPEDYVRAVEWFRKAAEQGLAGAQACLADMYENGQGVQQDEAEAVRWLRKAAEAGSIYSQRELAGHYLEGKGVPKDPNEASKWYRKVFDWTQKEAEAGEMGAQSQLGDFYLEGQCVTQDVSKAIKWYRTAAEQGFRIAQEQLGNIYSKGLGVPVDNTEAKKWYDLASKRGDNIVLDALEPEDLTEQTPVSAPAFHNPSPPIPHGPSFTTLEPLALRTGSVFFRVLGAVASVVIFLFLTKGHPFSAPCALIAAIALNASLVSSLYKIFHPARFLATLPGIFFTKQKPLTPLYVAATINQLLLLGLCFFYFKILIAIGAYLLGIFIMVILDKILGRLKWFGVFVYPVLVLILTIIAFKQIP